MKHKTRLILTLAIVLGTVLALTAALSATSARASTHPDHAPVRVAPSARASAAMSLTILHTNDVHAHFDEWESWGSVYGGSARTATQINAFRAAQDNVLVLDAGDQFQGTLFYNLFKADIVTATMNALGYDAMAIGNHEFDDGPGELARLAGGLTFPVLGSNVDVSADADLAGKIAPNTIITVSGEPIGILGLTTPEAAFLASPGPNVVFDNPVTAAQAAVEALAAQGIDKVIALTHLGYSADIALAQTVAGVDVIVGGHSHSLLYTPPDGAAGPYPTVVDDLAGNPVLIVTANSWNKYLGHLDVTFDANGVVSSYDGNPILMDDSIAKDPTLKAIIATHRDQVEALKNTFIGTSTVEIPVSAGGNRICRIGECIMGNLIADATLWKVNTVNPADPTHIALHNGGSFRAAIDTGPVSVGEIMEVLPFGNTIATFEITGTHIVAALESGVSRFPDQDGRFPQVAGMRYTWNANMPIGSRIVSVEVYDDDSDSFLPLDEGAIYKVATNAYVRGGGDDYTVFRDYAIDPYDFGPSLSEALEEYVTQFSPLSPELEGRIVGPDIVVSPLALSQDVDLGDTSTPTKTLSLTNMGSVARAWNITTTTAADWLTLAETTGILAPGQVTITGTVTLHIPGSTGIEVTFDATGLAANVYTTTLLVANDAPDELPVSVAVTLTVQSKVFLPLVLRE